MASERKPFLMALRKRLEILKTKINNSAKKWAERKAALPGFRQ